VHVAKQQFLARRLAILDDAVQTIKGEVEHAV
jgi:hypothetical protein